MFSHVVTRSTYMAFAQYLLCECFTDSEEQGEQTQPELVAGIREIIAFMQDTSCRL